MLTELNLNGLKELNHLYIPANKLEKIDLRGCSNLLDITVSDNNLKELDFSGCSSLVDINAYDNHLQSIDIKDCKELKGLGISGNEISSLDLSNNPNLDEIWLFANKLTELDLSNCKKLTEVLCYANNLSRLDLTCCPLLIDFDCSDNPISELDLSKNPKLIGAQFDNTLVEKIDFSHNPELLVIACCETNITSLDLSHNPKLMSLSTEDTNLTELDIRSCPEIVNLVKTTKRQKTPNKKNYYYQDEFEEKQQEDMDLSMLLVIGRYLGYPIKTELITEDPTPTPTNTPTPTPSPAPEKSATIGDFVDRLYTEALGRASEEAGKKYWVTEITSGRKTGGDCGLFFLTGEEFANRKLSVEDFVETLYKTFFGRVSEASGKAYWVGVLKNGGDRNAVVKGFIDSKEWCNLCADYGVRSGAPTAKAERASKNATDFATRLYTCCLGRDPEAGGLKYWALALTNLEQTGASAAKEFFGSAEFANLKTTNEEYVTRLYKTFMDREPEADGFAYWVGQLKGGTSRSEVLAQFVVSKEFTEICSRYGIERGNV